MDIKFKRYAEDLESKFQALISMNPVKIDNLQKSTPKGGVYLFSEGEKHEVVETVSKSNRKVSYFQSGKCLRFIQESVPISFSQYF